MSTATATAPTEKLEITPKQKAYIKRISNRWLLRAFFAGKLPLGGLSGMRVVSLDGDKCTSVIKLSWMTRNPFGTTYFAALSMAAELCNGAMTLMYVDGAKPGVATFPVAMTANFDKAAVGRTYFTCESGPEFRDAIAETQRTGEAVKVEALTIGRNEAGEEVCRFVFTWSFKRRG